MSKSIIVVSTSFRKESNSDIMADEFIKGARDAGHAVKKINLKHKILNFCKGCMVCQMEKDGHCIIQDDANEILITMVQADIIVFATPIYFYEMSGQMKTLLDRTNPLFPIEYKFRDIYIIATAADFDKNALDSAMKSVQGWISCFPQASLRGAVYGSGLNESGLKKQHDGILSEAYEMGLHV